MKRKRILLFLLTVSIVLTLSLSAGFAQYEPHTQVGLPEGAKARFGTGRLFTLSPLVSVGPSGIAYSPNVTNKLLAVPGHIGIWLYDTETLQARALFPGPMSSVNSMHFSPDGRTLAVGLLDGTIALWDVWTSTLRKTLTPHPTVAYWDGSWRHIRTRHYRSVTSVSFNAKGTLLAAGINNGTIELWNAATGELHKVLKGHEESVSSDISMEVSFSPDGNILASESTYSEVHLWDVATGELHKTLGQHSQAANMSFSPNGSIIATYNNAGELHLWDVATGELHKTFEKQPQITNNWTPINISFSSDGNTIATCGYDTTHYRRTVQLWDVATGTLHNILKDPFSDIDSIRFSPEGSTLAVVEGFTLDPAGKKVFLWDVAKGELRGTLSGNPLYPPTAVSPDGSTIATYAGDSTVQLWDVATGTLRDTFEGTYYSIHSMRFSPDGSMLAIGAGEGVADNTLPSGAGAVYVWDVATGTLRNILEGYTSPVRCVSFSPDGRTLAAGSVYYVPEIPMHEPTAEPLIPLPPPGDPIPPPNLQPLGPETGELYLWDVATGQQKKNLTKHNDNFYSVRFSPDGRTLAAGIAGLHGAVRLWDIATGEASRAQLAPTDGGGIVYSISFSPDGNTIVTGSGISDYDLDFLGIEWDNWVESEYRYRSGAVRSWDTSTGQLGLIFKQRTANVYSVGFSPDGQLLASGDQNGLVHLWDFATGTLISTLKGHVGAVYSVRFSPEGSTLITGSADGTVLLWEIGSVPAPPQRAEDVNRDNVVNIRDLVRVASQFGQTGESDADVNGDGVVNILDLLKVAAAFGEGPAAPVMRHHADELLTPEVVQQWLAAAQQLGPTDATAQRGIAVLEAFLAALTPKKPSLLPNYPNPFNPETWIPYHLAEPADVTVRIYAADGVLVRTLMLGHQGAGIYERRSRAVYWDGKNEVGEPVASSVYFYTLTAGDFTATRKMLIRK